MEYCGRAVGAPVTCCCPYAGAKVAKAYTAKVYTDPSPPNFTDNTNVRRGLSHASTSVLRCFLLTHLYSLPRTHRIIARAAFAARCSALQKFKCSSVYCVKTAAQCNQGGSSC